MLQFTDEALILKVDPLGDHDAIIHAFTPKYGVCRGVVKRGLTSKQRADIQPATLAELTSKSRLAEHMGTLTIEGAHSFAARVMHDPLKLAAVGSVMALLAQSLAEHDAHPELYTRTLELLKHIAAGVEPLIWLTEYVRLELCLLELVGFGLDLTACAATGERENLCYVSPKSGRAVSKSAGAAYHARLLPLPHYVQAADEIADSLSDIHDGLQLTGFFLEHRLFAALHRPLPGLRGQLLSRVHREMVRSINAAVSSA